MLEFGQLFIGGRWSAPAGRELREVVSPTTEQVIGRMPAAETIDMDRAVAAARVAFDTGPWPRMSFEERADITLRLADALAPRADELALQREQSRRILWPLSTFVRNRTRSPHSAQPNS